MTISGGPMTEDYDTRVLVGGVDAMLLSVTRDGCASCDACVAASEGCTRCGSCVACDAVCATCAQGASFTVPALTAGPHDVSVINAWGSSEGLILEVSAADTDVPDTDPPDTDPPDTDGR